MRDFRTSVCNEVIKVIEIGNDWDGLLQDEFCKDYFTRLMSTLDNEYKNYTIYPRREDVFTAFRQTSCADTKVVILGQDPYHGEGQSHGLAFSVKRGTKIPPSLRSIFTEISDDIGCNIPNNGHLSPWAKQGVLLLNTVLTVRANSPNSHRKIGWEIFTDKVIEILNLSESPIVFILWGNPAKAKATKITNPRHYVLTSVHPSPLSSWGGFFGCRHFSKANAFLKSVNRSEIDWQIPSI